ncbi:MAG TPA: tRNA uridine-5-carboxymethylaminomethyl(34) synthesis GTPase MnmE [Ignavibacteriaceae bacterium]|nr:tRNA uridine-5-carboxymethylaminomethyl(34) synthesis GTPase MnmE [Ignavibacteriaceae bacterium]
MNLQEDTIVALATPAGVGAIAVIRVSGNKSIESVSKIFIGKDLSAVASHTIHYGKIITSEKEIIDDVLISIFKEPNSYTGEESVEISTHGNPLISQKIINELVKLDVRIAEPGEFTKRAFLNGKLDLAQAEAVAEVISARSDASLKGARNQLDGMLSQKVNELRTRLINSSSLVELELDFAEEELEFVQKEQLIKMIKEIVGEIDELLSTYTFGRVIRDGVNVALVGVPNVGKSSLLNYFLKEARAIVSSIPGTTRDIIREEMFIDGILFRIFDTAGIRLSEDVIEIEGVSRSREAVKNADLVLFLNDVNHKISLELYDELTQLTKQEQILIVVNKIDLKESEIKNADTFISAKTGEGMDQLFSKLKEKALGRAHYTEKTAIVTNIRHFNNLQNAKLHLLNAVESAQNNFSGEFISVDLRNAEAALGEIIGEVTSDDILNNIFMNFCIGK